MSEHDLLADCLKDVTKERDDLAVALELARKEAIAISKLRDKKATAARRRIEQLEAGLRREKLAEGREHLTVTNEFQSDKYPWCPAGFVPLKLTDLMARDSLWDYARRRCVVDKEFTRDLEVALVIAGDKSKIKCADESQRPRSGSVGDETDCQYCSSDFDSPICGDQEFLRDERITCTRPPGHAGWHVACGAHHNIGSWPNDWNETVEDSGT